MNHLPRVLLRRHVSQGCVVEQGKDLTRKLVGPMFNYEGKQKVYKKAWPTLVGG